MPRGTNDLSLRTKEVVVIIKPHYRPDPDSPQYEDYCRQKLMLHKPFRNETNLIGEHVSFA
jgi:hypothetical protein